MGRRILALVGNPNVGKTVLFNSVCNTNERVGNWHGVTTERKSYSISYKKECIDIVDLPGCYNLSGYSLEERETADFLKSENCKVVNICDINNLERNLYLTLLLLEQNYKVLLFINNYAKNSAKVDALRLGRLLGVEILSKTAEKVKIDELVAKNFSQNKPKYCDLKFANLPYEEKIKIRYKYIESLLADCMVQKRQPKFDPDKLFLGKFDLIVFCVICFGLFYICFGSVGSYLTNFLQQFLQTQIVLPANNFLTNNYSDLLTSFVCDGLLSACLGLVCFLPQIMLVSFFINILQDCGYLSRIAFLFDGVLSKIGLSGKSIFSLLISFGCNTTALLTTGGQESREDKIKLSLFLPFICCSAKLPVFVIFTNVLTQSFGFLLTIALYVFAFVIGLIVLGCVSKYVKCKNKETFLLELGGYKVPNIKAALKESFIAAKNFLLKIGTVVFVANVIVWALQTFDFSFRVNKQNSMLKSISTFLAPIFAPIGLDNYGVVAALIVGILAKELVISTLAIINGISSSSLGLCVGGGLVTDFSPLTLIVFLVFVALYSPCISYLFGISKTLGKKYAFISFFVMTAVAYIVCMLIYFFGRLYLFSQETFIWAGVAAIFLIALVFIFKSKGKCTYCKNKNCPKSQK